VYRVLGLDGAPWDEIVQKGFDPETYRVPEMQSERGGRQGSRARVRGDRYRPPRSREDQAKSMPDIVREAYWGRSEPEDRARRLLVRATLE
jgi:hypothetical protein